MSENNRSQNRFCPCCGAHNDLDAVWCQNCGKSLNGQTIATSNNYQQAHVNIPTPKIGNQKKLLITAVLIGIIMVSLVSGAILLSSQPNNNGTTGSSDSVYPTTYPTIQPTIPVTSKTQLTALNVHLQYGSYDVDYFGPTDQTTTFSNQPNGVLEISPGEQFYTFFTMTESALAGSSDSIISISCTTPGFSVVSVQPATPVAFSPGSAVEITVTLQSPLTPYYGAISLSLKTDGGSPTQVTANQVVVKVDYSGQWAGAYGDTGTIQSWSGNGPYTLTLNRPSDASFMWVVSANAQKQDSSSSTLTVSILTVDGKVLKTSATSTAYGIAQVAVNVDNP